jgi:Flp pilus assembly protein CpaB
MDGTHFSPRLRQLRQALDWHRRLVTALLPGIAVVAALAALAPHPVPTRSVWTAARDLAGGAPLHQGDLRVEQLPAAVVPAGALLPHDPIVGRLLAAPVRRGEPLTDVRLLGPSLLASMQRPGLVAIPVRVADGAAAAALTRPGDVIDVLATGDLSGDAQAAPPQVVAAAVTVVAVPGRDSVSGDDAGLVVVAATPGQAAAIASASDSRRLTVVLRRS